MRWFGAIPLSGPFVLALSVAVPGCSNSDGTPSGTSSPPASQPAPTKFEAGANCASDNDCEPGLTCLFPATTCNALPVCVAALPSPCDHPQAACSCLREPITVCDGYATSPIESLGACEGGAVIVPVDGGSDATVPPADAGPDAPPDASPGVDAADAAGD